MQAGVSEQALRMTAQHVTNREQFGQLLASFQAVSQRAADAFIDTEAIRLTAWQAAWRLSAGLDADDEVAIAKFWAAEGGQRVAHAAQHLHGGVGADVDFPLRRYFTWAKTLELNLGSATRQLLQIGARLAARGLTRTRPVRFLGDAQNLPCFSPRSSRSFACCAVAHRVQWR